MSPWTKKCPRRRCDAMAMIVPAFWAEGRLRERSAGRQITVRRFGWSDQSPQAAQAHADARTREAFDRIAAGETLDRRERKSPYNGADGTPIREEIVSRHGETIVTRNSYGARCLNTPDVLFVDIDFETPYRGGPLLLALMAGAIGGWMARSWLAGLVAAIVVFAVAAWQVGAQRRRGAAAGVNPQPEKRARARIARFLRQHPDWHLRLYRTPAGLRALAMHRTFDPVEPVVADCFKALGADKVYARMCRNQHCFRARVSAKPWRIGIGEHLRPRPGVWPVSPDKLPLRDAWIARYEQAAQGHAACHFVEALGSATLDPRAQAVQRLHDELCRADTQQPLA